MHDNVYMYCTDWELHADYSRDLFPDYHLFRSLQRRLIDDAQSKNASRGRKFFFKSE